MKVQLVAGDRVHVDASGKPVRIETLYMSVEGYGDLTFGPLEDAMLYTKKGFEYIDIADLANWTFSDDGQTIFKVINVQIVDADLTFEE